MNKQEITNLINTKIIDNDNGLITAEKLRAVLNAINEGAGDGYIFISTATPSTTPIAITEDSKVFYIATEEGDYSNFTLGNISELSVIKSENGSWKVEGLGAAFGDEVKKELFEIEWVCTGNRIFAQFPYELPINNYSVRFTLEGFDENDRNLFFRTEIAPPGALDVLIPKADYNPFDGLPLNFQTSRETTRICLYFNTSFVGNENKKVHAVISQYISVSDTFAAIQEDINSINEEIDAVKQDIADLQNTAKIESDDNSFFTREIPLVVGKNLNTVIIQPQYEQYSILHDFKSGDVVRFSYSSDAIDYLSLLTKKDDKYTPIPIDVYANVPVTYIVTEDIQGFGFYRASAGIAKEDTLRLTATLMNENFFANTLKGKNVIMFGDSITQLPFTGDSRTGVGICEYFSALTGANVTRAAIGGTKLTRTADVPATITNSTEASNALQIISIIDAVVDRDLSKAISGALMNGTDSYVQDVMLPNLQNVNLDNYDIVTIFGGTNDYTAGVVLDGTDNSTISGALNHIIEKLCVNYPHLKVYIFTPIVRFIDDNFSDEHAIGGNTLKDISEKIIEVAKSNHIPVCDLYSEMWNRYNFKSVCHNNDFTHPRRGFYDIALKMFKFIIANQ